MFDKVNNCMQSRNNIGGVIDRRLPILREVLYLGEYVSRKVFYNVLSYSYSYAAGHNYLLFQVCQIWNEQ